MAYGDYGKTTELEAVNICLGVVGEQPVSAIGTGVSRATIARDIIYELSREIQSRGLACNTEKEYKLEPSDSTITLPTNTLSVDPSYYTDNRYVERNSKLYDTEDQTFTITVDVYVDIIWFLQWTFLPEHVRRYIVIKAARIFQKRYLSDENLHRFTEQDELEAKSEFERKELNIEDIGLMDNIFVNPRYYRRKR